MTNLTVPETTVGVTPVEGIPTKAGLYVMFCDESERVPEYVAITGDTPAWLTVCDQSIGSSSLECYHNGLSNIEWYLVS